MGQQIAVIGAGYVGLTTAACLARFGHTVVCTDVDAERVARLGRGQVDIAEPGLTELTAEGIGAERLRFTVRAAEAVTAGGGAEFTFLCVPTPARAGGAADLGAIESVLEEIKGLLPCGSVVVVKSTVPAGTAQWADGILGDDIDVVSNPEFLREGSAVADFLEPDRIVIGARDVHVGGRVAALYDTLDAPILVSATASAELAKQAANGFLAMKLSYANTLAEICEQVGADMTDVALVLGHDPRIGRAFLSPGPGGGGPCLPKDTEALRHLAALAGVAAPLVDATIDTNRRQPHRMVSKIRRAVTGDPHGSLTGARIGLLGLTFKAGVGDLRCSPALDVAELLRRAEADVVAHDPTVDARGEVSALAGITLTDDAHHTAVGADGLMLLTDWPQYRSLDWPAMAAAMRRPILVDTRNLLEPAVAMAAGLQWIGTGR